MISISHMYTFDLSRGDASMMIVDGLSCMYVSVYRELLSVLARHCFVFLKFSS